MAEAKANGDPDQLAELQDAAGAEAKEPLEIPEAEESKALLSLTELAGAEGNAAAETEASEEAEGKLREQIPESPLQEMEASEAAELESPLATGSEEEGEIPEQMAETDVPAEPDAGQEISDWAAEMESEAPEPRAVPEEGALDLLAESLLAPGTEIDGDDIGEPERVGPPDWLVELGGVVEEEEEEGWAPAAPDEEQALPTEVVPGWPREEQPPAGPREEGEPSEPEAEPAELEPVSGEAPEPVPVSGELEPVAGEPPEAEPGTGDLPELEPEPEEREAETGEPLGPEPGISGTPEPEPVTGEPSGPEPEPAEPETGADEAPEPEFVTGEPPEPEPEPAGPEPTAAEPAESEALPALPEPTTAQPSEPEPEPAEPEPTAAEPAEPEPVAGEPIEETGILAGIQGILPVEMIIAQPRLVPEIEVPESLASGDAPQARLFAEIVGRPPQTGPRELVQPQQQSRLGLLPRTLISVALIAAVLVPLLIQKPVWPRNVVASAPVLSLHTALESLDPGALVLVAFDYDPSTADEMNVLAQVLINHLMDRGAGIVAVSLYPAGPPVAQALLDELAAQHADYAGAYGQRYVNLGYLPGQATAVRLLGHSLPTALPQDFQGTRLADLPVVAGVADLQSFALIVELAASEQSVRWWVEQAAMPYQVPLAGGVSASAVPFAQPYYQTESRQLVGLAGGLPDAAVYASLRGDLDTHEGLWGARLDSLMGGHLVFILVLTIGSVVEFVRGIKGGR